MALSEQTNRLALNAAMDAARADALDQVTSVVEQVCRLAVGAGVAAGEITWLVGELAATTPDQGMLGEVAVAVAGMQSCMSAVALAVGEVADRGGPAEIASSAEALRRVATQLDGLRTRLESCV